MTLSQAYALGLAMLWAAIVVLGTLSKRLGAAVMGGVVAVAAGFPFMPRLVAYLVDSERFIARYGEAAVREVAISGVCVTLALVALVSAPLARRSAWGWLFPALASLLPVVLFVWVAFWFSIRF